MRDAFDEARFVYLIGNLGDDDCLAIFVESFDGGFGAHHEAATAVFVGFEDSTLAVNDSGGGEVGAFYDLENLSQLRGWIVYQGDGGIDDFGEVVGWNFRGHADGDSV